MTFLPHLPPPPGRAAAALTVAAVLLAAPGHAADITPSHVYQSADDVTRELVLLLDANFSDTALPAEIVVPGKLPRHVIRGAQDILTKLALLQQINGVPATSLAPIPVKEVTPADVKERVDAILAAVRDLKPAFKVTVAPEPAPLPTGRKPSDVYARLRVVDALVARLDMPAVVPNDVYQAALAMLADIKQVHAKAGAPVPAAIPADIKGKTPAEVYHRGRDLLSVLSRVVAQERFAIPGGVAMPPEKTSGVTPADVLEVLNSVLAELSSLKVTVGATEPTPVIPPQAGKTPTDSFIVIEQTLAYAQALASAN